jgi:hypothetical protein
LNIKFIKPDLPAGFSMFWLTSPPVTDTAFWNYWSLTKGVNSGALPGTWQWYMWRIIRPTGLTLPMFALYSDGDGNYQLCDGLLRFYAGQHQATLRVNGYYPKGIYTFKCNAAVGPVETDTPPAYPPIENVLEGVVMNIEFR